MSHESFSTPTPSTHILPSSRPTKSASKIYLCPFICLHHHLPGPNPSLWQWPLTGPLTHYVLCSTWQPEEPFYSLNPATSFSFPPITLSKRLALKLAQDPDFLCRCTKGPHLPNLKTTPVSFLFLFSREPWRRQCTHGRWDGA